MATPNPHYTESLRKLMQAFADLPGVGMRSAERMTFALLKEPARATALVEAIQAVKEQVKYCSICFNLTEHDPCPVCADPARDHAIICVVEQHKDLLQLESTGIYRGVYHVLLGRIAALDDIRPTDLTIAQLLARVAGSPEPPAVREIILATNPTMEGDGTSLYLQREIAQVAPHIQITRLARGLPAGAQIEYSNKAILSDALSGRTRVAE